MEHGVLITGASRGIGAAIARVFAQSGWNVALHYHTRRDMAEKLEQELQIYGTHILLVQGDVSDAAQVEQLVAQADAGLGGLDAVVCNAGIALPQQLVTDTTPEQWRTLMGVDLDGVYHIVRAVVPRFIHRKAGAIVTISSMWGVTGGSCEVAYSAAKAGVIGLTKALAKELAPSKIRVNCVAPGVIDTEMNAHLREEDLAVLREETPLGRIGTGEDVGNAVHFLCSEKASFITGQVLCVDGGMVI